MALPCLGWVFTFEPNLDRPSQVWLETSLLGDSQSALAMMVPIKHVLGQAGENQIPPFCSVNCFQSLSAHMTATNTAE